MYRSVSMNVFFKLWTNNWATLVMNCTWNVMIETPNMNIEQNKCYIKNEMINVRTNNALESMICRDREVKNRCVKIAISWAQVILVCNSLTVYSIHSARDMWHENILVNIKTPGWVDSCTETNTKMYQKGTVQDTGYKVMSCDDIYIHLLILYNYN